MKYVLLAYRDKKQWESMSASERAVFEQACQASERDLTHSRYLIDAWDIQNTAALTVRIVDDAVSITDGPAAKGRERLIEILFIEARDLNAAVQLASKMPQAREGPIEVRTLVE